MSAAPMTEADARAWMAQPEAHDATMMRAAAEVQEAARLDALPPEEWPAEAARLLELQDDVARSGLYPSAARTLDSAAFQLEFGNWAKHQGTGLTQATAKAVAEAMACRVRRARETT